MTDFMTTLKQMIKSLLGSSVNESGRQSWLVKTIADLKPGLRILDAGAGELRNRSLCHHLQYVSQDFCQYEGKGDGNAMQTGTWDTSGIDLVCDITAIPEADSSFDAILCSEVLEHVPDPLKALDEFTRLLKPGGVLILTAPFSSLVHFAPFHFCTGFSRYWYEHHLGHRGYTLLELEPNGDWYSLLHQELLRLPAMDKERGLWHWLLSVPGVLYTALYLKLRAPVRESELACFGWHCLARKDEK